MGKSPLILVYVIGCQRSGTTLTGQILGAHPHALLLDEPDGMYPWFDALDPDQTVRRADVATLLEKAGDKYANPASRIHPDSDGKLKLAPNISHLILKAPNLTYARDKIARLKNRTRIVSLIRDPRDVVASMQRLSNIPMVKNQIKWMEKTPNLPTWARADMAQLSSAQLSENQKRSLVWKIKTGIAQEFRSFDHRYLRLIYEELVSAPKELIQLMCRHVHLSNHPHLHRHHDILVGVGPGKTNRQRAIDTTSIAKSDTSLGKNDSAEILRLAGSDSQRYRLPTPVNIEKRPAPIVLVGRGGSGTRLLSELVQNAGIFVGNNLNACFDSVEWVNTLNKIAERKLAIPQPPNVLALPDTAKELRNTAQRIVARSDDATVPNAKWGWKLPITMMLIPEVLHAFPDAKIIQIVRHPVTSSIRRTHKTSREDNNIGKPIISAARAIFPPPHRSCFRSRHIE